MVPEADVEIFDSESISLGTGCMILEAVQAAEAGRGRASIDRRLEQIRHKARLFLTPSTLKYLQMSGRVGKLQGALASLLHVKPIIALEQGLLEATENVRTRAKALERLLELMEQAFGRVRPINLAVIHARAREEAEDLLRRARARLNFRGVLTSDLVCSLAVHGDPPSSACSAIRSDTSAAPVPIAPVFPRPQGAGHGFARDVQPARQAQLTSLQQARGSTVIRSDPK